MENKKCDHEILYFGSGAFYLFCSKCGVAWVAITNLSNTDVDYSRAAENLSGETRISEIKNENGLDY
jgi:hypothetical protein